MKSHKSHADHADNRRQATGITRTTICGKDATCIKTDQDSTSLDSTAAKMQTKSNELNNY